MPVKAQTAFAVDYKPAVAAVSALKKKLEAIKGKVGPQSKAKINLQLKAISLIQQECKNGKPKMSKEYAGI